VMQTASAAFPGRDAAIGFIVLFTPRSVRFIKPDRWPRFAAEAAASLLASAKKGNMRAVIFV